MTRSRRINQQQEPLLNGVLLSDQEQDNLLLALEPVFEQFEKYVGFPVQLEDL